MLWSFLFIFQQSSVKPAEIQPAHSSRAAHGLAQGQLLREDGGQQGSCDHTYGLSYDRTVMKRLRVLHFAS